MSCSLKQYQDVDWLENQYKSNSINQIADMCSVAPATIRKYFKRFNIKSKSISEAAKKKYQDKCYLSRRKKQWSSDYYKDKHKNIAKNNKKLKSKISKKLWDDDKFAIRTRAAHIIATNNIKFRQKVSKAIKNKWKEKEYKKAQCALSNQKSICFSTTMKRLWRTTTYRAHKITQNQKQGDARRLTTAEFIRRSVLFNKNHFDYDESKYTTYDRHKINIICVNCRHTFSQTAGNHLKGARCPHCNISSGQREIYDFIDEHSQAILNDRAQIHPLELDIWIPSHKLAIEYHGLRWHSFDKLESQAEKNRHQKKALTCLDNNIQLLQFWDYQWENKKEIVKSIILHKLGLSKCVGARHTIVNILNKIAAKQFFDENHLYGHKPAKHYIGLICNSELLMAISISTNAEIVRFASKIGCVVVGGLGKLLSYINNNLNYQMVYSFADLNFSTACGYLSVGFQIDHITKPGYFYYRGKQRLSRQQCQKHKLARLLGNNFNPLVSESINMFNNRYRRVWDAGNIKLKHRF